MSQIEITVNGEERGVPEGTTVAALLLELSLRQERLALELNRRILPRDRYEATALQPGDRLEIVTFVGGG